MSDSGTLVNAHTHLYSGLAPLGMPAPDPAPRNFLEILEKLWWRLDRALDEPTLRASARYYVQDALLRGCGALVDHHESPRFIHGSLEVLADACQELGMRAVICYGATERNGGRAEAEAGLAECARFLRENDRPLVRGVIGLHASFTVGDETLREAGELCREFGTVLHVHLAEDRADVEDARERGWPGPLARLLHFGCLPPGSILAHGVHLDGEQVRECSRKGLWLIQNPRSNENNRVGRPEHLAASQAVALGTDGFPAAMLEEEKTLLDLPLPSQDPEAERAARPQRLPAGRRLLVELFGHSRMQDRAILTGGRCSEMVVGGERVIVQGELQRVDREAIVEEARTRAEELWSRMDEID